MVRRLTEAQEKKRREALPEKLLRYLRKQIRQSTQSIRDVFKAFDADGSGFLDMEDVVAARAAAGASSSVGVGGAAPVPPAP